MHSTITVTNNAFGKEKFLDCMGFFFTKKSYISKSWVVTDTVLEIAWNHPNDEFLMRVEELFCQLVGINLKSFIVDNAVPNYQLPT